MLYNKSMYIYLLTISLNLQSYANFKAPVSASCYAGVKEADLSIYHIDILSLVNSVYHFLDNCSDLSIRGTVIFSMKYFHLSKCQKMNLLQIEETFVKRVRIFYLVLLTQDCAG